MCPLLPTTPLAFPNAHIPDSFISYHFFRQGYAPGIIGVSHGALQFMAYEELKKAYSRYFGTPINQKLVRRNPSRILGLVVLKQFSVACGKVLSERMEI